MLSRAYLCRQLLESPLVKTEGYMQHTFRWGIGNKFRSVNANRYSPVHHARPKEVTIPSDYFDSPNKEAIKYDRLNEQWEVYWYEHNKLHAKPFPVKKFGIEKSKSEAIEFLESLKDSKRFSNTLPPLTSSVEGVLWDERLQMWVSLSSGKGFSVSKHGVENARMLAERDASKFSARNWRSELTKLLSKNS